MLRIRLVSIILALAMLFSGVYILINFTTGEGLKPIAGSTYYVDDDFNVATVGWGVTHFNTIQQAIDNASTGDTIRVWNGTYFESILINKINIEMIGNSTTECRIIHYNNGTDFPSNYAAGINVTAMGVNISRFNISVSGNYTVGICITTDISNLNIRYNNISTTGTHGYGIILNQSSNNNITGNTITTSGSNSDGIRFTESSDNNLTGNVINAFGQYANGIHLIGFSNNSYLTDNTAKTLNSSAHGILIKNSNNTLIMNNLFIAMGTNSMGLYQDSYVTMAIDSTFNSSNYYDIYLMNDANLTIVNCSIYDQDVTSDGGGVLQVRNYLDIQAYYEDQITPIPGADVEILDNVAQIYASIGYGGINPGTDINGQVSALTLTDRVYVYLNTPTENTTTVNIKKTVDRLWEETRQVNMNTSHIEIFNATDIFKPSIPAGLKVTRIPGTNSINVSWNLSADTVNYTIYDPSCQNTFIRNITHPLNWTRFNNLADDLWYTFAIGAWDNVSFFSGVSTPPVMFYLSDIMPPAIPNGLKVTPVPNGDAFNITWNLTNDNGDTIFYDVQWENPSTRGWVQIANLTNPSNWTIFSNTSLQNGTLYNFSIRAWDKVEHPSGLSTPESALHMDYIEPLAPTNLTAQAISDNIINLSWDASVTLDILSYQVFINRSGNGSGGQYIIHSEVFGTNYSVTDLIENVTYYFVVSALDEASNPSLDSNEAWSKTIAIPPEVPELNNLPLYTNDNMINILGVGELNSTIFIYSNGVEVGNDTVNSSGGFDILIQLDTGINKISAKARDRALLNSSYSAQHTVISDQNPPSAITLNNISIQVNEVAYFDASGSIDNFGIANYSWSFDDDGGIIKILYGEKTSFKFTVPGTYEVTLKLRDLAGNFGFETFWVNVTEPVTIQEPIVESTAPEKNATKINVSSSVIITFDIVMNTSSVENAIDIVPPITYNVTWSNNDKTITITFPERLNYDTEYRITIDDTAMATNSGILKYTPFVLRFSTEEKPEKPVIEPKSITLIYPDINSELQGGETITITGTSTGFTSGTQISAFIGTVSETGTISADGSWSIDITVPNTKGPTSIKVTAGDKSYSIPISIIESDEPGADGEDKSKDDDKGLFGFGGTMDLLFILIIVIVIIIILLAVIMTRKKGEEDEDKGGEESTKQEEEETVEETKASDEGLTGLGVITGADVAVDDSADSGADAETAVPSKMDVEDGKENGLEEFECPECGAGIDDTATVCSSCGAEFEEEDDEDQPEDEEVGTEEGFECPECGADLDADATVCPSCGSEFED